METFRFFFLFSRIFDNRLLFVLRLLETDLSQDWQDDDDDGIILIICNTKRKGSVSITFAVFFLSVCVCVYAEYLRNG